MGQEPVTSGLHVGIIMDGNGRWAVSRGLPRVYGHDEGLKAIKKLCTCASGLGIGIMSIYAFSTENWKRAQEEVSYLIRLIHSNIRRELDFYRANGIRLVHSGDKEGLPAYIRKDISDVEEQTKDFGPLIVNLAFNYGGRDEIIRAVKKLTVEEIKNLDEERFSTYLDQRLPDPDLIIRTANEKRLSNFLLWQSAYSELYFSEKLWPDFCCEDLEKAVEEFKNRKRKFGGNG
jgi:undecaprenyl diphosphate synthase